MDYSLWFSRDNRQQNSQSLLSRNSSCNFIFYFTAFVVSSPMMQEETQSHSSPNFPFLAKLHFAVIFFFSILDFSILKIQDLYIQHSFFNLFSLYKTSIVAFLINRMIMVDALLSIRCNSSIGF